MDDKMFEYYIELIAAAANRTISALSDEIKVLDKITAEIARTRIVHRQDHTGSEDPQIDNPDDDWIPISTHCPVCYNKNIRGDMKLSECHEPIKLVCPECHTLFSVQISDNNRIVRILLEGNRT